MKNAICKTVLAIATLAALCSCSAKRSITQHDIRETTETASVNRTAIRSVKRSETISAARLKIYETIAEKDTCGRTLKETRRMYDFSGHNASAADGTTATVSCDSTAATSAIAETATEEKTSEPAALSLAMTIAGMAAAAMAAAYILKKLMKFL